MRRITRKPSFWMGTIALTVGIAAWAHEGSVPVPAPNEEPLDESVPRIQVALHVAAPQDPEIARLGELLNETYVPFGAQGVAGHKNQVAQDVNARSASPGSGVQRAVSKASGFYCNSAWDLVDAVTKQTVDLEDVKTEDLPEPMRDMNLQQRRAYVQDKVDQRRQLQEQIRRLDEQRRAHVAEVRRARAESSGSDTLDVAMIKVAREQAVERGFAFE